MFGCFGIGEAEEREPDYAKKPNIDPSQICWAIW